MLYIHGDEYPYLFDSACALYGAKELDISYEVIEDIPIDISNRDVYVGSVDFIREVFKRLGVKYKPLPNSNREYMILPLKEAMELRRVFIKPLSMKLFTGFIYEGYKYTCLNDVPLDTEVMVYDLLDIVSEWRTYIYRNEVLGTYNYSGDPLIFPNKEFLENTRLEKNKPIAYVIDVGILKDNSNVIIEFNDMWAIGNYGLPNYLYTRSLIARFKEIVLR